MPPLRPSEQEAVRMEPPLNFWLDKLLIEAFNHDTE